MTLLVDARVKMSSQLQCSKGSCYHGSYAVDGITTSGSLAQTLKETSPWIQIDLGDEHCILYVKIYSSGYNSEYA